MKVLTSSDEAKESCMETGTFAIAFLHKETPPLPTHIHRCLELYYSISGGRTFCVEDKNYRMEPGDLFFLNQYESHCVSQTDPKVPYERFVIFIHPDYLEKISTDRTNLSRCFTSRPHRYSNRLALTPGCQRRFLYYVNKLAGIRGFGSDIAERSAFSDFMLFLTTLCMEDGEPKVNPEDNPRFFHPKISDIVTYINQNIESLLTIGDIAAHFYLSGSYLCRLFKKTTGVTINRYITLRRIDLAKNLLADGFSVNETCGMCGFNDYSNFFKAFTKEVGISPKKYSQNLLS